MEFEEVLAFINEVTDNICNNFEAFNKRLEETFYFSQKQFDENENVDLKQLYNRIKESRQQRIDEANKTLQNHFKCLQKKREEVNELRRKRDALRNERKNIESKIQKIQKDYEHYEEKLKQLQNLKDSIKTYKLLTGTNFAYKKGSVTGYIKPKNPLNFEVFDFNSSQVNQHDMTTKLWTLLENISREHYINNKEENKI